MPIIANICGIAAVAMFVLSYQLKNRNALIFMNAGSRVLYVLQYVLLGAFEGAVLDIVALVVSVVAQNKDKGFVKKHTVLSIAISNLFILASGLLFYRNIFSLLPIAGVLFETGGLWASKAKNIRIISLFGAPCWLAYNLLCGAYGSVVGNVLTLVSIGISLIRYDILKQEKEP